MTFPLVSILVHVAVAVAVVVVVVAEGPQALGEARSWPCPDDMSIYPCRCTTDSYYNMHLDCSDIQSNSILDNLFENVPFPIMGLDSFIIKPDTPAPNLTRIKSFGDVSFNHITISNTYIDTVYPEALRPSYTSLQTFDISNNLLSSFPIEIVPLFDHLQELNLAYNKLPISLPIQSHSLLTLSLAGNIGLSLSDDTFSGATKLEKLYLNDMQLGTDNIPPDVFSGLNFISVIDLSNNRISGTLPPAFVEVPLDSLQHLLLSHNDIVQINATAITGASSSAIIDFRWNVIDELDENNWQPLLDQVTEPLHSVDLRENPLLCGCDVLWLLLDEDQLSKVHQGTKCYTGTLLSEVPLDDLLENC